MSCFEETNTPYRDPSDLATREFCGWFVKVDECTSHSPESGGDEAKRTVVLPSARVNMTSAESCMLTERTGAGDRGVVSHDFNDRPDTSTGQDDQTASQNDKIRYGEVRGTSDVGDASDAGRLKANPDDADPQTTSEQNFDDLLETAGGGGRFQMLLVLATSMTAFSGAISTFTLIFIMAEPEHWCVREDNNRTLDCVAGDAGCEPARCHVSPNQTAGSCVEWAYALAEHTSTVVSDFDLVCERAVLRSMMFTVNMLAGLAGALLFGPLGDRYGRARVGTATVLLLVPSSALLAAAPNLGLFAAGTALFALSQAGTYICLFTLCMEMVGERWRSAAGMFWVLPWAVGIMATALAAWLLPRWWQLRLAVAASALPLLPVVWWQPESPRWLAERGRWRDALAVLRRIADVNGRRLPDDVEARLQQLAQPPPTSGCCREVRLLFGSPRMVVISLTTIWLWVAISLVYYGIAFDAAQLASDAYLATCLSGLVEVPTLLVVPLMDRFGRRSVMAASYLLTAAAILLVPAMPAGWPILLLGLVGKLASGTAFGVAFVFIEEYMPTEMRNAALGMSIMAEGVGAAVSAHVAYGLGAVHWSAPSVTFGVVAVSAGLLTLLVLPETVGRPLPDTVGQVRLRSWRRRSGTGARP